MSSGVAKKIDEDALDDRVATTAAQIDSLTQALCTDVREMDEASPWFSWGFLSTAHWLAFRTGMCRGQACEMVRVARALGDAPLIDEAFARGELSFGKVQAMTRVVTSENERELLHIGKAGSVSHVVKICRMVARCVREQFSDGSSPAEPSRYVSRYQGDSGLVRIVAQLLPDEAALVLAAIDKARDQDFEEQKASAEAAAEPARMGRADGLVALARDAVAEEAAAEAEVGKPDEKVSGKSTRSSWQPVELVVTMSQGLLGDDKYTAHLVDGTAIATETLERLACDAGVVPVVIDDETGEPLSVGRRTRTLPAWILRAVKARDGHSCSFPGCTHTRYLDAHHLKHWMAGGETSSDNTCLLCTRHHTMVHEGGFQVKRGDDGVLSFRNPMDRLLPTAPGPPKLRQSTMDFVAEHCEARGLTIDADTAPRWDGVAPDYGMCVDPLLPRSPPTWKMTKVLRS